MKTKIKKSAISLELFLNLFCNDNCTECGSQRKIVKLEDLPEEPRKVFENLLKIPIYKRGATFLYCKHCEQYSILSSPNL